MLLLSKRISNLCSIPLTILFHQSVATETFPDTLKTTKVSPIHKSCPHDEPKYDRPISQLRVISKIFETLMKSHFVHYLECKKYL